MLEEEQNHKQDSGDETQRSDVSAPRGKKGRRRGETSLQGRIVWKLGRLSRLMHRARLQDFGNDPKEAREVMGFDPNRGQGRILKLLHPQDGIAQRDIARTLDIRPQSLGELLGKLEERRLIARRPDELDKRVQLVFLTEEGRRISSKLNEPQKREKIDIFGVLSEEEKEQLDSLLDKLIDNAVTQVGEDARPRRHGGPRPPHPDGPYPQRQDGPRPPHPDGPRPPRPVGPGPNEHDGAGPRKPHFGPGFGAPPNNRRF